MKLVKFEVNDRIDSDNFRSVAHFEMEDDGKILFVKGQYNARTNTFNPGVLGDPYSWEDRYDEMQRLVEGR